MLFLILSGASGFISQPHFLNAEKQFTDAIEGMAPDENKHDFVLHFEPVKIQEIIDLLG